MASQVSYSEKLVQMIFDALTAHIAIIDGEGRILAVNKAWKRFSSDNDTASDKDFTGINYLTVCEAATDDGAADARAVALGIREVIQGQKDEFLYDYPCHSPQGKRWFYMRAVPMADGDDLKVIVSHEDITELKLAQEDLDNHRRALEEQNLSLEEANTALRVLIRQREADQKETEEKFLTHIKTFVLPYVSKLKGAPLGPREKTLLSIVEDQLSEVMNPLMGKLANAHVMLTPQEMQVAALVREGKTSAEIADALFVSEATVSFHRKNLRKKLGLTHRGANLRSFLLSMS